MKHDKKYISDSQHSLPIWEKKKKKNGFREIYETIGAEQETIIGIWYLQQNT